MDDKGEGLEYALGMANELYVLGMIEKRGSLPQLSFRMADDFESVWMGQEALAVFFELPRKAIISGLSSVFKQEEIDKKRHLRKISYVQDALGNASSKQEVQYSLFVILRLAFVLEGEVALAFRSWALSQLERFLRWGFVVDKDRVRVQEKRRTRLKKIVSEMP